MLDWRPTFLLAMPASEDYESLLGAVRAIWRYEDVDWVSQICRQTAESAIANSSGKLDAMQDVLVEACANVVRRYYGLSLSPGFIEEFLCRCFAVAGYLFGLPSATPDPARAAIDGLWRWLDESIAGARVLVDGGGTALNERTPLIERALADPELADETMRSMFMGMTLGFIPAGLNAFGRSLLVSLRSTAVRRHVTTLAGQDLNDPVARDALHRAFVEGVRLNYILPAIWRRPDADVRMAASGRRIRRGTNVFLAMPAALRDRRRHAQPRRFSAQRSLDGYLVYGHGMHFCAGAYIADTVAVEAFGALFSRGAALDGKVRYNGAIPWKIPVSVNV